MKKNEANRLIDRKQDLIDEFYNVIEKIEEETNNIKLGDEVYSIVCSITPDGHQIAIGKNDVASKFIVNKMFEGE